MDGYWSSRAIDVVGWMVIGRREQLSWSARGANFTWMHHLHLVILILKTIGNRKGDCA